MDEENTHQLCPSILRHRIRDTSPESSPHKLGKVGPKRQRTVSVRNLLPNLQPVPTQKEKQQNILTLQDYKTKAVEEIQLTNIRADLITYVIHRIALNNQESEVVNDYRLFMSSQLEPQLGTEPSKIHYLELINENADSNEAMLQVADDLLNKFSKSEHQKFVVLVGDGKTYLHLMQIKRQYGMSLEKLLIFPGDWHILKNYQEVLMKIYYVAGLKETAIESGYQGMTLQSLETAKSFKRTHQFLLQTWEAVAHVMVTQYLSENDMVDLPILVANKLKELSEQKFKPDVTLKIIQLLIADKINYSDFHQYLKQKSQADSTWKFWSEFLINDCLAYIGLYTAIRGRNWNLRLASLKLMAPLFYAFDCDSYQRIIPDHLHNILSFPASIVAYFEAGGFAVNVTEQRWHSVALDEAHEMCVNKDLKGAVIRSTDAYLQKTSLFFNYRINLLKHFKAQLYPEEKSFQYEPTIMTTDPAIIKMFRNVSKMARSISEAQLLPTQTSKNRGLINSFTNNVATPEQANDILAFRNIGEEALDNYITHVIIGEPSTTNVVRRHKLLTMASPKTTKRKLSQKEKENKVVVTCLRRSWHGVTGQA